MVHMQFIIFIIIVGDKPYITQFGILIVACVPSQSSSYNILFTAVLGVAA